MINGLVRMHPRIAISDFFQPHCWAMIEDTISGSYLRVCHFSSKFFQTFQTQMIKQKSSLRPNLRSLGEKSPLRAAKCQLQFSTTVPEELDFFCWNCNLCSKALFLDFLENTHCVEVPHVMAWTLGRVVG